MSMQDRTMRIATAFAAFILLGTIAVYADGADPKTVTPAWVIEQQLAQQQAQAQQQTQPQAQPEAPKSTTLFFIGYDYPTLSGALANHLTSWGSLANFSVGMESWDIERDSLLSGLELECFFTTKNEGIRLQLNDIVMVGYSFNLAKAARLNLGARLGIGMLDVTDYNSANPSYFLLGGIAGPEASLYGQLAKDFWLWVRGRYTFSYYFLTLDSSGTGPYPLDVGDHTLNCLSLEAGIAFRM